MPLELGARRTAIENIINTDIEIFKHIAGDFWIVKYIIIIFTLEY